MGPNSPFSPPAFIPIQQRNIGCGGSGHIQFDSNVGGLSSQGSLIRPDHNLRLQRLDRVDSLDLMGRNFSPPDILGR
jgi:hypothetical protein